MPLTFPSHAAIVLPLKLWRPRWFDGVGLVLGSTAPDLPYAAVGVLPYTPSAHNLLGVLVWCVPVTLLGAWLVRWAAPPLGVTLGSHRWWVTASSAALGAVSHLFWDGFTHDPESFQGWATAILRPLTADVFGYPSWWLAQQASTVLGGLATVWMFLRLGVRPAWPPRVFWPVTLGTGLALVGVSFLLPAAWFTAVIGVRVLISGGLALLAGAWAVRVFAGQDGRHGVPHRARHDG